MSCWCKSSCALHKATLPKTFFIPFPGDRESCPIENLQSLLRVFHLVTVAKETRYDLATWPFRRYCYQSHQRNPCAPGTEWTLLPGSCLHCSFMEPWLWKHKWQQQEQTSVASLKKFSVLSSIISWIACICLEFRWSCIGATYLSVLGFLCLFCSFRMSRRSKREVT